MSRKTVRTQKKPKVAPETLAPQACASPGTKVSTERPFAAGDRLLMGWRHGEPQGRIGFGAERSPVEVAGDPVWLEGEGHMITIAPTGAGKGRGALIPNLLTYEGPAIIIDPKGEACRVTARRRREMGQKVYIIDPFKQVTENTDMLNPFDAFDLPGVDPSSLSMEIARLLSGGPNFTHDRFWDIRGHDLAAGVIAAVASISTPDTRNLNHARKLLKSNDVVHTLATLLDTHGETLHRYAYEEIASVVQTTDVTRSGIIATACSYFSVIASDAAQKTVMSSTVDLNAVARGDPMTIYMVVPPSKLASHSALFRLWTSALMSAVLSRESDIPEMRTLFAIDECAQLGDFDMLAKVYTLARAYGMRVWTFFQDLAQVKRILPKEWQTVLTSSAAIQVFGVPNHLMATDLAEVLGDFSADELRHMNRDLAALQISGQRGMTVRRLDYLTDPVFAGLFDANPMMSRHPLTRDGGKLSP